MTPDMWTQVYWLLASYTALIGAVGLGCWYGLKKLPLEEDL